MEFDDKISENDICLEDNGIKIAIDNKSALFVAGSTVDYLDSLMGAGFKIINPNAKSSCGCGESFSV